MDFHSMIGKLRAIESLGVTKNYVAEEEATTEGSTCSMTAEGESCPVHGLKECPTVPMEEGDIDTLKGMLKNSGQMDEGDPMGFGNEWLNSEPATTPQDTPAQPPNTTPAVATPTNAVRPSTTAAGMPAATTDTSGGVTSDPTYKPKTAAPTPAAPAAPTPAPAATTPTTFKDAFRAARKEAGGAGGVFMWNGKPYQTNIKGEPSVAWNSPTLKKVGSGWPAAESIDRVMELAGLRDSSDIQDIADDAKVDDMSTDMSIEDLMRKYGVSDEVSEDAPLVGAPFTPLGATNNGPEEWGMVVTGGTDVNHFEESVTVNSNMDVRDGRVTKSLSISATDEDVDRLAAMLRNAGIGDQISVKRIDICDGCGRPVDDCACDHHGSDCGCGAPEGECQCGMALENADHDYGNKENSSEGEPLDTEEYVWDGPHLNQRFGKIGDNTLMAERAISIFKNYSKEYSQVLAEADLEPSNAGFDSPLTANNRDEFDKDPFVDETPVDDGSRSPLSTVKRQDVMN